MNKHEFDILLQRYLAGECDEEEAHQVELWSKNMLAHSVLPLENAEKKKIQKRIWKRLSVGVLGKSPFLQNVFLFRMGIAASVLLGLFGVFWLSQLYFPNEDRLGVGVEGGAAMTSYANDGVWSIKSEDQPQVLSLDDGSTITLGKNSFIRYPVTFDQSRREVYLEGEAFFNVARDEDRPFMVYSGGLVTRVLGTSFNIRSTTGKTEVEVVSGSVSVYENNGNSSADAKAVILTPNQKAVFEKNVRKLEPELVNIPIIIHTPENHAEFIFEGEALTNVLKKLSDAYGVVISLDSPVMLSCIFTGDLNGLPLHVQLDLICRSINGSYEQKGNTYTVTGDGCLE